MSLEEAITHLTNNWREVFAARDAQFNGPAGTLGVVLGDLLVPKLVLEHHSPIQKVVRSRAYDPFSRLFDHHSMPQRTTIDERQPFRGRAVDGVVWTDEPDVVVDRETEKGPKGLGISKDATEVLGQDHVPLL